MRTEEISQILFAFGDPFTLLAGLLVVLGIVIFVATRKIEVAYKGVPIKLISAMMIAIAAGATIVNVARLSPSPPPKDTFEAPKKSSTLQVTFYGMKSRTESVTVPFRVSSGQVNVGCNEVRGTQVTFPTPIGARNVVATPSWENIRDVKQQDKNLTVQGNVVMATGQLVGNNREWTGNCPGGGHGELVVTGSYVIDQSADPEQVVISTFQGFVQPNSSVNVPLPTSPALPADMSSELSVATAGGLTSKLILDIKIDATGNATGVVKPSGNAAASAPAPLLAARVEGKTLAVDVR
ncbi:hypothetical protein [Roseateles sp. P5_E1]